MGELKQLTDAEKNIFNNGFIYVQNASATNGFFSVKNKTGEGYTLKQVSNLSGTIASDMNTLRENMIKAFLNPNNTEVHEKNGCTPRTFLSYLLTIGPTAARAFFKDVDAAR